MHRTCHIIKFEGTENISKRKLKLLIFESPEMAPVTILAHSPGS
jgi:hypothetical protein